MRAFFKFPRRLVGCRKTVEMADCYWKRLPTLQLPTRASTQKACHQHSQQLALAAISNDCAKTWKQRKRIIGGFHQSIESNPSCVIEKGFVAVQSSQASKHPDLYFVCFGFTVQSNQKLPTFFAPFQHSSQQQINKEETMRQDTTYDYIQSQQLLEPAKENRTPTFPEACAVRRPRHSNMLSLSLSLSLSASRVALAH